MDVDERIQLSINGRILPIEILQRIISILPLQSRPQVDLTCKLWYEISKNTPVLPKKILRLQYQSAQPTASLIFNSFVRPIALPVDPISLRNDNGFRNLNLAEETRDQCVICVELLQCFMHKHGCSVYAVDYGGKDPHHDAMGLDPWFRALLPKEIFQCFLANRFITDFRMYFVKVLPGSLQLLTQLDQFNSNLTTLCLHKISLDKTFQNENRDELHQLASNWPKQIKRFAITSLPSTMSRIFSESMPPECTFDELFISPHVFDLTSTEKIAMQYTTWVQRSSNVNLQLIVKDYHLEQYAADLWNSLLLVNHIQTLELTFGSIFPPDFLPSLRNLRYSLKVFKLSGDEDLFAGVQSELFNELINALPLGLHVLHLKHVAANVFSFQLIIERLTYLRELCIIKSGFINDDLVSSLGTCLPELRALYLERCRYVSTSGIKRLLTRSAKLETLQCAFGGSFNEYTLEAICNAASSQLRFLKFQGKRLRNRMPQFEMFARRLNQIGYEMSFECNSWVIKLKNVTTTNARPLFNVCPFCRQWQDF